MEPDEELVPGTKPKSSELNDLPLDLRCIKGTVGQELSDSGSESSDQTGIKFHDEFPRFRNCSDRFYSRHDREELT